MTNIVIFPRCFDAEKKKIELAHQKIEHVLNSNEFRDAFLNKKFTQLGQNEHRSNYELLAKINKEIIVTYAVVKRPWYKSMSSVIGFTIDDAISTYRDSFNIMNVDQLAGHIAHEIMHTPEINFTHDFLWSPERDSSIPYWVGSFVQDFKIK